MRASRRSSATAPRPSSRRSPQVDYVYNDRYDQTNTSKSLLRALAKSGKGGVLWMNGDVVFDPLVLGRAIELIERDQSFVTVNTSKVSDEEVKYTVTAEGFINQLSKTVTGGIGEAVGINYISSRDKKAFIRQLTRVDDQDYFERGLELAIEEDSRAPRSRSTSPTCTRSRSTSPKTSSGRTSSSDRTSARDSHRSRVPTTSLSSPAFAQSARIGSGRYGRQGAPHPLPPR